MVAFLMRSFEDYKNSSVNIGVFKNNVDDLVNRNQIYPDVRDIIYQIFGIVNTNVFKPTVCQEKIYKINMYISKVKMLGFNLDSNKIEELKQSIEKDYKLGFINKQIKDILYDIFDLNATVNKKQRLENEEKSKKVTLSFIEGLKLKGVSQEVINDICLFKEAYLEYLYYYYPNDTDDKYKKSINPYLSICLLKALKRPKGSVIKYYKKIADGPCASTWDFVDVPKEAFLKPKIETPKKRERRLYTSGNNSSHISACDPVSSSRIC